MEKGEEDREEGAEEAGVIIGEQTKDNEKKGVEESMDQGGEAKKDGEISEVKTLSETAKKQVLMMDEEFEVLLEGAQLVGQEATEVAEGLDLASPVAGERILSSEPINVSPQPEEKVETKEPKAVLGDPESDKGGNKMAAKPSKRKLTLTDDTMVEGKKPTRTSWRRLVREQRENGEVVVASEAVEVSSGEDDAPQDESAATSVGQSKNDSTTKLGEDPQNVASASSTHGEVNPQSLLPTHLEEPIPPTKPGEGEVPQSEEGVKIDEQRVNPIAQEETPIAEQGERREEEDEERY